MSGKVPLRLMGLALGLSALLAPARAWCECGDAERASPVYQAMSKCQMAAVPKEADLIVAAATATGSPSSFCRSGTNTGIVNNALDPELCGDPSAFVCKRSSDSGMMLTSNCHLSMTNPKLAAELPDSIVSSCETAAKKDQYIVEHAKGCTGPTANDCLALFRMKHGKELLKIERDTVYTPARIAKATALFNRVKAQYLAMIDSSTLIPSEAKRKYLHLMISQTGLATSPDELSQPSDASCHNSAADGVRSTAVYNSRNPSVSASLVHLCIGMMAALDSEDPYAVMSIIGHELSHSIDPCSLEMDTWWRINGDKPWGPERGAPRVSDLMYPGIVACLNGGTGLAGCTDSVLHCTTQKGRREACSESASGNTFRASPPGTWQQNFNSCDMEAANTPSCNWGKSDREENLQDASDYRGNASKHKDQPFDGQPISQIGESFSDFMGGAVLGKIIAEDSKPGAVAPPGPIDLQGKRDALIAISTELGTLHGTCLDHNTLDEHPPGYLRTNRNLMGSKSFRDAIGCAQPAKAERGGTTCPSI